MSRFVKIPYQSDDDSAFFVNTDHVVTVLLDKTTVYITLKKDKQVVSEFDTPEKAKDFIEKNFILFNA